MKKIIYCLITGMLLVFMLSACGSPNANKPTNDQNNNNTTNNTVVDPDPNTSKEEVTLYFANKEYITTGNEDLEKVLPEKRTIEIGETSKAEAIVKELIKGTDEPDLSSSIPQNVKLNSVKVADGIAYVDFSSQNLSGGSLQERMMIAQIVQSLTQLENVEKVQFLKDGKKPETLMGHAYVKEPLS